MPHQEQTVAMIAEQLAVRDRISAGVKNLTHEPERHGLIEQLLRLPVRPSRAIRSLGSYVSRRGEPSCIRLQYRQSPDQQRITLLHELAHACDHLVNQPGRRYRRAHGPGWQRWAIAFGIAAERTGHCPELEALHRERLKLVAVCQRCGAEIHRLRRLPKHRRYIHPPCGGRLLPVPD